MPTVGAQLRPRWAVQVSALYFQQNDSYSYAGLLFINGGLHQGVNVGTSRRHTVAVPVLARYTLTRRSEQHFKVDILAGATAVRLRVPQPAARPLTASRAWCTTTTSALLKPASTFTLGPSLRYHLGQQFDLTGDLGFNFLLNSRPAARTNGPTSATPGSWLALPLRPRLGPRLLTLETPRPTRWGVSFPAHPNFPL
ncbi:MAG: hypothetical protein WKG07_27880 [Hymenobacter sp.]